MVKPKRIKYYYKHSSSSRPLQVAWHAVRTQLGFRQHGQVDAKSDNNYTGCGVGGELDHVQDSQY